MSEADLHKFLSRNPLSLPNKNNIFVPVLLSDSKAARLAELPQELSIEFLYKRGASTSDCFKLLQRKFCELQSRYNKPLFVYVWCGTCDITKKTAGRYIDISDCSNFPSGLLHLFGQIKTFVLTRGGRIKFIGVPCYSVSLYNLHKGHPAPNSFTASDIEVVNRVAAINRGIAVLNNALGKTTLKFNADLVKSRAKKGKPRNSYNFSLLSDGLHPGQLLSRKWLRKLSLDIIKECYPSEHPANTIAIDQQEYLAFAEQETHIDN